MSFKIRFLSCILFLSLLAGCSASATQAPTPQAPTAQAAGPTQTAVISGTSASALVPAAVDFVNQITSGNFSAARAYFDATMLKAVSDTGLSDLWKQVLASQGAFQKQTGTRTGAIQQYQVVFVTCQFANGALDFRVVFDADGKIGGLQFTPPPGAATPTPVAYNPPAYVNSTSFHEVNVTVGSGDWALPGTLTLPNGAGPFPGIVLVQGSGPSDRDETVGPNRPFRDLAWGLASQGIAVLRYDKRTYTHAKQFTPDLLATITVQEETIDDAVLAVQLLQQSANIDPRRVFLAGHSLGAMLAPRIATQAPGLAGVVMLAGNARPLEDVLLDQFNYLYSLNGGPTAEQQKSLETLKQQISRVKDPALSPATPTSDLPINVPAAYWLDLRSYDQVAVAKSLSLPLLILQGQRDYQVSAAKDFTGWQTGLAGKTNVTFKLYAQLNHLFIAGTGPSIPDEYAKEGHIDQPVIGDIAQWINHP